MRGMHERDIDTTEINPLVWIIPLVFFCGVMLGAILNDMGLVNVR